MKVESFTGSSTGRLATTIQGQSAFVPNPLPPKLEITEFLDELTQAVQAIGELRGACRRLANPYILVRPLQRQEALTSSAMEGTYTSADNLLLAEAGLQKNEDNSTR